MLATLLVALGAACSSPEDAYHPRTPLNIARGISQLPIPDSARLISFSDNFVDPHTGVVMTQGGLLITLAMIPSR